MRAEDSSRLASWPEKIPIHSVSKTRSHEIILTFCFAGSCACLGPSTGRIPGALDDLFAPILSVLGGFYSRLRSRSGPGSLGRVVGNSEVALGQSRQSWIGVGKSAYHYQSQIEAVTRDILATCWIVGSRLVPLSVWFLSCASQSQPDSRHTGNRVLVCVINASGENTRIFGFGTENSTELNTDCSRLGGF
jgi:hypothetical protein